ncbi:TonB-dependent receptor [Flaviaesturariibacter amylovorans]|uniref:TonB-dependent receptor n=1 Tax=Flaviaesturariibacter amylovorans TaxID=1084520 RepID=A0ABP8HFE9_9BACT
MRSILLPLLCTIALPAAAQHTLRTQARNDAGDPLPGATLTWKEGARSVIADSLGNLTLANIPSGQQTFVLSHVGYGEKEVQLSFPLPGAEWPPITLERAEEEEEEEEEVIVTATRTSRTIANTPTRTEVISGEELEEKGNMKPGDIRMLLNESTGIQTQQTSATSYNAGIRIQGLDGRYTQLLRDGYPLYGGFAGGLSLLQVAPLDLRQVEVIKGSASTLYGGGAIAGLVNLVSKTPGERRELSFLLNATSAGGLDASGFYSERYGKAGLTLFASRNSTAPFDPAGIGFTAIPKAERYTVNPRLFLYGKHTTADIGISYTTEDRLGGSTAFIKDGTPGPFERNETDRIATQLGITHRLGERHTLQLKNSFSFFDRALSAFNYLFDARQVSSFTEISWNRRGERSEWVLGANLTTEALTERNVRFGIPRDYTLTTAGLFAQHTWSVTDRFTLETGLRGDHVSPHGFELLPRASLLYRISTNWTTRLGGGFGYKAPTIFTEEAERLQYRVDNARITNPHTERSVGANWDVNYTTKWGALGLQANVLFFYTRLSRPLLLANTPVGYRFYSSAGHIDTRGAEANLRLTWGDFKLFVGYTLTDAQSHLPAQEGALPLVAQHRLNNVLMYEVEGKWKLGLEAYYTGRQPLNDGSYGRPYWITGFMAERLWKRFSIFVNFENFTDTRQTKFGPIYSGPASNPQFRDIYAPLEGFVVNGGIKLRF